MQILLSSSHCFPALRTTSAGLNTTLFPSGSAYMTQDLIARGLAELGHDVCFFPRKGATEPLPDGVRLVSEPKPDVDIHHILIDTDEYEYWKKQSFPVPRVISCHIDPRLIDRNWGEINEKWIFVSHSLAQSLGRDRYVWNGIDPNEYIYSTTKQDYHLFMAPMDWGIQKGLDIAIKLSKDMGFRLVVAGGSSKPEVIQEIKDRCKEVPNIDYVGDVRGALKAQLLAGARSLIFPTKINEAFGLVIAEALMSGTPVICSKNGACNELVSPNVGFLCDTMDDYMSALHRIDQIRPEDCRKKALEDFHYKKMAKGYVAEYEREIALQK